MLRSCHATLFGKNKLFTISATVFLGPAIGVGCIQIPSQTGHCIHDCHQRIVLMILVKLAVNCGGKGKRQALLRSSPLKHGTNGRFLGKTNIVKVILYRLCHLFVHGRSVKGNDFCLGTAKHTTRLVSRLAHDVLGWMFRNRHCPATAFKRRFTGIVWFWEHLLLRGCPTRGFSLYTS